MTAAKDSGEAEVQARFDEHHAKGYVGSQADETPNSAYTVAGVTADLRKAPEPAPSAPEKAPARRSKESKS